MQQTVVIQKKISATLRSSEVTDAFRKPPQALLDVGHSRLAYRRFGQGPDLLFVHGWPLHAATFRALIPELAAHFTCHLIDLPGAGQTERTDASPIDLLGHARTLRAAADALKLERYALVAHDSGGGIARLLAADDPRVAALVSGNTEIPGHHPLVIGMLKAVDRLPGGIAALTWAMRSRALRRSRLAFGGCFADTRHLDGEFHTLFIAPLLGSRAYAAGQFSFLRNLDVKLVDHLHEVHARMRAPTLLIWGDADPIFPLTKARAMLPQFGGGAALSVLSGGKCFVHEEQPDAFVALALPFLRAHLG